MWEARSSVPIKDLGKQAGGSDILKLFAIALKRTSGHGRYMEVSLPLRAQRGPM